MLLLYSFTVTNLSLLVCQISIPLMLIDHHWELLGVLFIQLSHAMCIWESNRIAVLVIKVMETTYSY